MGWEEEEGDPDANTAEGGTGGVEKKGRGISRALVVITLALKKGTVTVDIRHRERQGKIFYCPR